MEKERQASKINPVTVKEQNFAFIIEPCAVQSFTAQCLSNSPLHRNVARSWGLGWLHFFFLLLLPFFVPFLAPFLVPFLVLFLVPLLMPLLAPLLMPLLLSLPFVLL